MQKTQVTDELVPNIGDDEMTGDENEEQNLPSLKLGMEFWLSTNIL